MGVESLLLVLLNLSSDQLVLPLSVLLFNLLLGNLGNGL